MKKFTFLALTATLLISSGYLPAQQRSGSNRSSSNDERCGTMQWLEDMQRSYPGFKEQFEQNERILNEAIARRLADQRAGRINVTYTIPVVFHVVLPNPNVITDVMLQNQLLVLNQDFSGLNPDSANAVPFYPIRGHSNIQFCFAQRTPTNGPTNGINRVASSTVSSGPSANDPIKSTAAGGSDAWDPTRYFNVWFCNFSNPGLLGYATFPIGTAENPAGPLNQQGIVNLAQSVPGGTAAPYNLGRTAVHEAGHFFWLRHIWGDAVCGNDFPGSPAGLDDTPQQSDDTFGCPTGAQASGCPASPNPPGRNYQNYMDYTDDACMTMFTNGQGVRAETALLTFRNSLTTSNGCLPPVLLPDNASISAIVTPTTNFVTCDPTVPLTVTLRNAGSNPLTSVTITVKRNGTTVQTFNPPGLNLASNSSQNINLTAVALVNGANAIEVCTSLPNGNPDADPSDDCKTQSGTRGGGAPLPLAEGFESTTFPPTGWLINNPDAGITWQRNTTGIAHGGVAKAFVNHFNYSSAGQIDDITGPPNTIGTADSLWVSFWGAYRGFPGFPFENFQVLVSTNCGASYTTVYNVRNDTVFVAPAGSSPTSGASYFPGNINQWVRKSVDLTSFIPAGFIQVRFRSVNQFGNNFHLDDINIDKKIFFDNDAGVIAITKPTTNICVSNEAPQVVIQNYGKIPLTSVQINYQIDGAGPVTTFNWTGNLARNQTALVTLPSANYGAVGNHSINVFTTLPNNVADQDPSNDGQTKPFNVKQIFALPGNLNEDFTNSAFPPANWSVVNPNADITWQRNATVGRNAAGSAWFNDFVNNSVDRIDDLAMPNYSYSNIDSIFMNFNLAHITRTLPGTTGARLDTLSVLLSKDCGNTFTTIYKKWGEELQTVNDPNFQISFQQFTPAADQWRKDSLNLGKWLGASEPLFQLIFRFHGNFENNFFLDDINLRTQVLPAKLKNDGYLILPNPFNTSFGVWHYQLPTNLRYINVYNSAGQLVWSQKYNGGDKFIRIDLAGRAAGLYTVNIGYEDSNRNVTVPVIKY